VDLFFAMRADWVRFLVPAPNQRELLQELFFLTPISSNERPFVVCRQQTHQPRNVARYSYSAILSRSRGAMINIIRNDVAFEQQWLINGHAKMKSGYPVYRRIVNDGINRS